MWYNAQRNMAYSSRTVRPPQIRDLTGEETAWLAGILEGEGSFLYFEYDHRGPRCGTNLVRIQMSSTDRDILERVARLVGVGRVRSLPDRPRFGRKPQWGWSIQAKADVRELTLRLLPWLGERRTEQANRILAATASLVISPLGTCRNGHVIDENNRRRTGSRNGRDQYTCRKCFNERRNVWEREQRTATRRST